MLIIHIRLCRLPQDTDPDAQSPRAALLTPGELARCRRLPEPHAARALVARALVRSELSGALGVDPAALDFAAGAQGKPFVLDPPQPLAFNLSHSGEWLALAWHVHPGEAPLGIDVEHVLNHRREVMRLARRYFSPAEQATLGALEGASQRSLFHRLWTLKEAWVKAHGLALAPQLGAVSFSLRGDSLALENGTPHASGRLLHAALADEAWLSLCLLGDSRLPVRLDVRLGVPLGSWTSLSTRGWLGSLARA